MASTNWKRLLTGAVAIAGIGAIAVYLIKVLRDKDDDVDGAIDELIDLYTEKAADLDRLVAG